MKKVALLSVGWKRLITYAWVNGIVEKIQKSGEEVCLYHYNCFGSWSVDSKYNDGEYNIYNLTDLSSFDGIILDCTNIEDEKRLNQMITLLQQTDVPVVSLVYQIDGFYYAGIDNLTIFKELVEHLYEKHGCRSFLYAGGPEGNSENTMRMRAFRESLEKYGIPVDDSMFWFGDYNFDTGVRYMRQLYQTGAVLPDAIVCANDNIAAGICAEAETYGLRVPDDFLVTGFDNLEKASYFRPQITTASINRESCAAKAMEILLDIWAGKEVETYNVVPSQCIFAESCGCGNSGLVDYREHARDQILQNVKRLEEDQALTELELKMTECTSFTGIFREFAEYFSAKDCDGIYIVIDELLMHTAVTHGFPTEGYRMDRMIVGYACENKEKLMIHTVEELKQHLGNSRSGDSYMFTPIHFREETIGFSILKNGRFLYETHQFFDVHTEFMRSLESMHKRQQLERMYKELKMMYNRDPMTGLYNRNAYLEIIKPEFLKYCEEQVPCALIFYDVDFFKEINDSQGHEFGDRVLIRIADVLERNCPRDGYVYRFGGDEFIVFFPNATSELAEAYNHKVKADLDPFQISLSPGVVITDPLSGKDLDEYLIQADCQMYEAKRIRHKMEQR